MHEITTLFDAITFTTILYKFLKYGSCDRRHDRCCSRFDPECHMVGVGQDVLAGVAVGFVPGLVHGRIRFMLLV